jgi:hypothetical protein
MLKYRQTGSYNNFTTYNRKLYAMPKGYKSINRPLRVSRLLFPTVQFVKQI